MAGGFGKDSKLFDEHIGRNIREQRTAAELSQTVLGNALGVSFQQIQKFETGHNRISAGQLWLLCHFLDVPITAILDGAHPKMFKPQSRRTSKAPGRAGPKAKK